jgi:hypothetical protein
VDWQMRIFQRNTFNVVAKSLASGIRIFHAYLPSALLMNYADEAADIASLVGHPQTQALDFLDLGAEIEPQCSEQSNNAPTLLVSPSDDDTEVQSSIQSSGEGGQSIASRTKLQPARQRLPTIALPIEFSPLEQHSINGDYAHRLKQPPSDILIHK